MKTKTLNTPLKGERDYIQGPDLFNLAHLVVSEHIGTCPDTFEIAFHRMAHRQVELVWDTDVEPKGAFAVGSWTTLNGGKERYWIRETKASICERQPYPEEKIVEQLEFSEDFTEAKLVEKFPYSVMEIWVTMIKSMHQRRYADVDGKWVFARAKIWAYDPSRPLGPIRVEMSATLGTKLTRNSVFLNSEKIGDVYFGLV